MRINSRWGCDTAMCFIDVYLESAEECAMDDNAVWHAIRPLIDAQDISRFDVVDFFRHVCNAHSEWVPVFRNEDGNLMWWNEQGERVIVHRVH